VRRRSRPSSGRSFGVFLYPWLSSLLRPDIHNHANMKTEPARPRLKLAGIQIMHVYHIDDVINIKGLAYITIGTALFGDFVNITHRGNKYYGYNGGFFV